MKYLALASILLLATACGGGGAAPAVDDGPQLTPLETAQKILDDCVAADLTEILDLLDLLAQLQDPNTPAPAFNFAPQLDGSVAWDIDTDNDTASDLFGAIRLLDPSGTAYNALQLFGIFGGIPDFTDFAAVLADLPEGAQIATTFNRPGDPLLTGGLTLKTTGGVPDTASGSISVTNTAMGCTSIFSFTDLPAQALLAASPTGVFDVAVNTPNDNLTGDVTFDGTPNAIMSLSLNGGAPMQFNLNLDTQVVTPLP